MKKLIGIVCVLALMLSLTACSGDKTTQEQADAPTTNNSAQENTPAVKEEKIDKYINEQSLNNTDNITFMLDSVNEDENYIINVKSADLTKDIVTNVKPLYLDETAAIANEKIDIDWFANDFENDNLVKFSINNYQININTEENYQSWNSYDYYTATLVKEDGIFYLVEATNSKNSYYDIWVKAKNQYILVHPEIKSQYTYRDEIRTKVDSVKTLEDATTIFNFIKENITFATAKTEVKVKDGISWKVPNLTTATLFGSEQTSVNVSNWIFAKDMLYKHFDTAGLNLMFSGHLNFYSGCVVSRYNFELTEEDRNNGLDWNNWFSLYFTTLEAGDSYDMGKTINEFKIGETQFKLIGLSDRGMGYALKVKTETGSEFLCEIDPYGNESEADYNYIHYYLEKVFSK